jgi:hypothetical protein
MQAVTTIGLDIERRPCACAVAAAGHPAAAGGENKVKASED